MNNVKPWQLAVIVIGLLVGVGSLVYTFMQSEGAGLSHRFLLVDVETGVLYSVDTRKSGARTAPAVSPETGKRTLLAVVEEPAGKFVIPPRELELLDKIDGQPKAINSQTGEVNGPTPKPKPYKRRE